MPFVIRNLYQTDPAPLPREVVSLLHDSATVRIEQIVSHGQPSPKEFWYDQAESEWVVLLQGSATLFLAGDETVEMKAGDYLLIPARLRHRVEHVSADALWLAVHFRSADSPKSHAVGGPAAE